jgi:hypothetical protein
VAIVHLTYPPRPAWPAARFLAVLGLSALAATAVAACSPSSAASATALYGTALHQQCTAVADVLSDGPDPDADPVGYAQAQVLPLRQLTISDTALSKAVTALTAAYRAYAATTGQANTTAALAASRAEAAVNAICPGAAN